MKYIIHFDFEIINQYLSDYFITLANKLQHYPKKELSLQLSI